MKNKSKKSYVYDIETFSNFFCAVFKSGKTFAVFEISERKNDYDKLLKFYSDNFIKYAVGFNNINFDAQVLHWMTLKSTQSEFEDLSNVEMCEMIFDFAQEVIESKSESGKPLPKFGIKSLKVPQIDLYRINHYDNLNKATSLKWVEFSLNHPLVQDLPYSVKHRVKLDEIDEIIEYCKNDVNATYKFMLYCTDLIKLRIQQDESLPGFGILNKPDSSVGETIFLKRMSEAMNIPINELRNMRTYRNGIKIKDILLPYINFKTREFQDLLEFYKNAEQGGISKIVHYKGIDYVFGEGGIKCVLFI